jgi:arsenite transporter
MVVVGRCLTLLGRGGPSLLVLSLIVGALAEPLASLAYRLLPLSAFLLTTGSFLAAALSVPEPGRGWRRLLLAIVWVGIGVPMVIYLLLTRVELDPALRAGVLLSVLAPPVGSAAAIATILGLRPRLALITSILLTLMVPISMPLTLTTLQIDASGDASKLALRLAIIIGSAALLARAAQRWPHRVRGILPGPSAAAGVAVIGLIIVGLAMSRGVRMIWEATPELFLTFLAAAVAINLGIGLIGSLLFSSWGVRDALTVGLVSGNRNVTLAWATAGPTLAPIAEAYVAVCVLPVLALPLILRSALTLHSIAGSALRKSPTLIQDSPKE